MLLTMTAMLGTGAAQAAPVPGKAELVRWRDRIEAHLKTGILDFWLRHGPDPVRGGFHGSLDRQGKPDPASPRSLVQQSRILWTFSAARRMFSDERYRQAADRQFAQLAVGAQHGQGAQEAACVVFELGHCGR